MTISHIESVGMIADSDGVCRAGHFAVVVLTPSRASPLPQGQRIPCGSGLARDGGLSGAEGLNGCI
ncbi:hypothetical protein F6R97_11770 [Pseudomonas sp. JV414]|nr:hypothetical protein [Pseudomonas sp. JV414]